MILDPPIRILLVDDHPLVRIGLASLIGGQAGLSVCAQASAAGEVASLVRSQDPDVVVLDLMLGHDSGLDLLKSLMREFPYLQVLVLSMHDQRVYAERCLQAGAKGYLQKQVAATLVVQALRTVARGGTFVGPNSGQQGGEPSRPLTSLSDREMRVFELIGEGLPTRAIATALAISDKTVETHKANIKRKLGVTHAQELLRLASEWQRTGGGAQRRRDRLGRNIQMPMSPLHLPAKQPTAGSVRLYQAFQIDSSCRPRMMRSRSVRWRCGSDPGNT